MTGNTIPSSVAIAALLENASVPVAAMIVVLVVLVALVVRDRLLVVGGSAEPKFQVG